jgi:hypothetical protein
MRTIADPQFRENATDVMFHGIECYHQYVSDFLVRSPSCEQTKHVEFTLTQRIE